MNNSRISSDSNSRFPNTRWSLWQDAVQTGEATSHLALEQFCQTYWYPLYAFSRRKGHSAEDAKDLTQSFFHELLAKDWLGNANRERGKLRTFLLTLFQRFMAREWRSDNSQWFSKGDFGILRLVQFLSLAYLSWVIAGDKGNRVRAGASMLGRAWAPFLAIFLKVGQQSLAVFVVSIIVGRTNGFIMDIIGRDTWTVVAVNLFGMMLLVITAYAAGWFKTQPWKVKR